MFKQAATYNNTTDLQEYSETVTAYITKCIDDVTVTKTITVRANQKPWLTGEVYRLLKARNAAFRAGDQVQVQVELYCHSATCGDMQWNEMSCLTGPRCYINTDIQQLSKTL